MRNRNYDELVLSIIPTHRGITYTLFEAPLAPVDWGLKRVKGKDKNARSLEVVVQLCKTHRPDTLVIENVDANKRKRAARISRLLSLIASFAESENLNVVRYSRKQIQKTFREAGAISRREIAQAIASYIPAFEHRMPRVNRLWQSEDIRFSLFDAAALALTHFAVVPEDTEPP